MPTVTDGDERSAAMRRSSWRRPTSPDWVSVFSAVSMRSAAKGAVCCSRASFSSARASSALKAWSGWTCAQSIAYLLYVVSGAQQYRLLAQWYARNDPLAHHTRQAIQFGPGVRRAGEDDRWLRWRCVACSDQRQPISAGQECGGEGAGGAQNLRARTVVAPQRNDARLMVVVGEVARGGWRRAAEAVDRLIRVANGPERAPAAHQRA